MRPNGNRLVTKLLKALLTRGAVSPRVLAHSRETGAARPGDRRTADRAAAAPALSSSRAVDRDALKPAPGRHRHSCAATSSSLILYCHGAQTVEQVARRGRQRSNAMGRRERRRAAATRARRCADPDRHRRRRSAVRDAQGQIGWWVRNKLPQMGSPDRVRAAVDAVFRTDLAMKSSGGEPRLLERLVVQLRRSTQSRPRAAP